MSVWLSSRRVYVGVLCLLAFWGGLYVPEAAAQQEPSPITVELVVQAAAGAGSVLEVRIEYEAADLNAGANLNYNVFGPAHVVRRDPEPSNPIVNTWYPGAKQGPPAKGTLVIEVQVDQGAVGQSIEHQVEVRWGSKVRVYSARTAIQAAVPTAAPTARPRPRPTQPAATPTPAPTATPQVKPTIELRRVVLLDGDGRTLAEAQAHQVVYLEMMYSSSAELSGAQVEVRFEPAVVELEGAEAVDGVYRFDVPVLAAAQDGRLLDPVVGRIGSFSEGGSDYALRAIARIIPAEESVQEDPGEVVSQPVRVTQETAIEVRVSVDATEVRAGESLIVHVLVENQGSMPARQVRIALAGLPEGYAASPDVQEIEQIAPDGGTEQRLITVRSAEGYDGTVVMRVVASMGEVTILSEPVTIESKAPVPLRLEAFGSTPAVYAGEAAYIRVTAENVGSFPAKGVTARLIDVAGHLGVLLQEVGEIAAGQSAEWVFVVDIPADFPFDVESSFVVQTVSADGLTSESDPVGLSIACRPRLEVYVEPPGGRIVGGQALETIVLVKNAGPCVAREVVLGLEGLSGGIVPPPPQAIPELAAGGIRYITFNLALPQAFRGEVTYWARAQESTGGEAQSEPASFPVGGMPIVWSIVLGLLALLAIAAIVVGTVLYLRAR